MDKFEDCEYCDWSDGRLPSVCDTCEDADQFEQASALGEAFVPLYPVVKMKVAA